MENVQKGNVLVMVPESEWIQIKETQQVILNIVRAYCEPKREIREHPSGFLTALEFMSAVKIKRWKFDQLISANKIKAVKKKRKIYVPVSEVERYFTDPKIQ
jgi:hypothetical protein